MSILSAPHFHDETAAIKFLEAIIYADGVFCPKCGFVGDSYTIKSKNPKVRPGLRCCKACRKQFTVKVGTVFEDSHIPLRHWLQAMHLLTTSKKGFSAHQLHRTLAVTYKTAWFMAHRIREAMAPHGSLADDRAGGLAHALRSEGDKVAVTGVRDEVFGLAALAGREAYST